MARVSSSQERQPAGAPKPFSREWLELPPEQRFVAKRRGPLALPVWLPSERMLTGMLVALLVISGAIAGGALGPGVQRASSVAGQPTVPAQVAFTSQTPTAAPVVALATGTSADANAPTPVFTPTVGSTMVVPDVQITPPTTENPTDSAPGALLPKYRIISYYGHPLSDAMGVLGEYDKDAVYEELLKEKEAWESADPTHPVLIAFEIIGSVAQGQPAENGTYLYHTSDEIMRDYVNFTREKGMILIIDLQIGRSTIAAELDWAEQYLIEPHVHVALDPEFAMGPEDIPGEVIGGIDATKIQDAQRRLADLAATNGLPPKLLIVHRFAFEMITNIELLGPYPGVQTVIDFDGWGVPDAKVEGFEVFIRDSPVEFAGIKLFYKQDTPLMQPEQVLQLDPMPNVIIYQ